MLSYVCESSMMAELRYHRGRPRISVSDMTFCAVMRAIRGESARASLLHLRKTEAETSGLISHLPNYSSLLLFMKRSDTRQHLLKTIHRAADLLMRVPVPQRRWGRKFRFAEGFRVRSMDYNCVINEALCTKIAEMVLKCCVWGVEPYSEAISPESLLSVLRAQIPPGLSKDLREELYQEMVVAVLSGQMRPDRMRGQIGALLRKVRGFNPSHFSIR